MVPLRSFLVSGLPSCVLSLLLDWLCYHYHLSFIICFSLSLYFPSMIDSFGIAIGIYLIERRELENSVSLR